MTVTRPLPAPTVTEATAKELIASIGELNTSMAVVNVQLQNVAIKFNRQEDLNIDIEKRMKEREIEATKVDSRLDSLDAWKKTVNGFMLSVAIPIAVTVIVGVLYIVFKAKP